MENLKEPTQYSKEEAKEKIGLEYHVDRNMNFRFKSMDTIKRICEEANESEGVVNIAECMATIIDAFSKELPFFISTELKNTFTENMRDDQGDLKNKKYNKKHIFTNIDEAKSYALTENIDYKRIMLEKVLLVGDKGVVHSSEAKLNIFSKIFMKLTKKLYLKDIHRRIKEISASIEKNEVRIIDKKEFNIMSSDNIKKMHFLTNNRGSIKHTEIDVNMEGYTFYDKIYYPAYMVDNFGKVMKDQNLKDFKKTFLIPHLSENLDISPFSLKIFNQDKRVVKYVSFLSEDKIVVHNSTVVFSSLKALNKYLIFEEIAVKNKTKAISDLMEKINIS